MFSWEHQYLTRSLERTISLFPLKHKIHVFSPAMPVIPGTDWEAFKQHISLFARSIGLKTYFTKTLLAGQLLPRF